MRKIDLQNAVSSLKAETRDTLQKMYDELNHGQQKKMLKNEEIKTLFDRYGVKYTE